MDRMRLAPLVGIVACLLYAGLLVVPYLLVRTSPGTAVGTYYGTGELNPAVGGLFALVALIVFAAGREGRTDPGFAAGVSLVLGLFMCAIAFVWALTVPFEVVVGIDAPRYITAHRWALGAVGAVVLLAGGWWAATLDLL